MKLVNCPGCGETKKYGGKNLCKSCYDHQRLERRNELYRISKGLSKDHKFPERTEKCVECGLQIEDKKRWSVQLCLNCGKKAYRRARLDQWNEKQKIAVRLKRGLSPDHPNLLKPRGSGHITKDGYKTIHKRGHPNAKNRQGALGEHIFVMSEYLKRPLFKGESVHHKNGIRHDNRIENLELWHRGQPAGQRVEDKITFYKEFLEQYGYDVIKRSIP